MSINIIWEPQHQRFGLYITKSDGAQKVKAMPVKYEKTERFEYVKPCVTIENKTELQELMDDLWSIGLRPSARSDEYKAQLKTMNNHLNDMRTLVFKERKDLTI